MEEEKTLEDQLFCMIVLGKQDGKFNIFPILTDVCCCNNLETKHFQVYAKYNEDNTDLMITNKEDLKLFEQYCQNLKT